MERDKARGMSMTDNLQIWNKYRKVPKNALKAFDNGRFKGTDINTMWRIKSLTEEFGVCGIGWYYDIIRIWNESVPEEKLILTFAEIKLYIKVAGEWSKGISGVGGNKMLSTTKDGRVKDNDEAVKMAVTDAIGVACRNLGFGADIYWENDKTTYTNAKAEKINEPTKEQLQELLSLGGTIQIVAQYYKVDVEEVSAEMVQKMIDLKKRSLAKEQAKKAEVKNANK